MRPTPPAADTSTLCSHTSSGGSWRRCPSWAIVVVFVFLLVRIAPGDPAAIIAGDYATPENIQKIRAGLGLDKPIHVQFALYVGSLLRGDLGQSLHSRRPVSQLIVQRWSPPWPWP